MRGKDKIGLPRPPRVASKSKSQLQDDSIMGTNNSSIVSKRSVERLYFPNEPHFFRYFVKKPLRRSPLINRGYWLRMKAVDHVVSQFLEQGSDKRKIVINLGCGYDPLPWQCLTRYTSACANTTFIDIDYEELMIKKRDVVQSTNELKSTFTNVEVPKEGAILLRSDQYLQIGCDLRNLTQLEQTLASCLDIRNCLILFTAEVSITYMDVEAADALIKWAGTLPQARFCLLEQLLPDGIGHPFAQTMMAHFDKLQTPLRPVQNYPTTSAQQDRFQNLGWASTRACNLWKLWSAPYFISPSERRSLDAIEPFDEWEEFALFGCHYVLLVANTGLDPKNPAVEKDERQTRTPAAESPTSNLPLEIETTYSEYPKGQGCRRFASAVPIRGQDTARDRVGNFAGMGLMTRTNSIDIYATDELGALPTSLHISSDTPSSRMCHTITDLGDVGALLVGGRTSPDNALGDCWLYHKWLGVWERVDDLPQPRYRHQAVNLGHGYVLVSTGRSNSQTISSDYLIWNRRRSWIRCSPSDGETPVAIYGATFTIYDSELPQDLLQPRRGILAGGISGDALLQQDIWEWELREIASNDPRIIFRRPVQLRHHASLARFGASIATHHGGTYIIGGIVKDQMMTALDEACAFKIQDSQCSLSFLSLHHPPNAPRPLLIGSTVASAGDSLLVIGGSAVCFSFGTCWNKGCYTLHTPATISRSEKRSPKEDLKPSPECWKYLHTINTLVPVRSPKAPGQADLASRSLINIPRVQIRSPAEFNQIMRAANPVIIGGLDLGACTSKWTAEYLKEKVGEDREIVIHEATTEHMNFSTKNFSYVTKSFGEFLDQIDHGRKLYLRSLSSERPSELPADISRDFPSIAADFQVPVELSAAMENTHSSPLRISGPVTMWLHYDVMANILCQIRGSKQLLLFPPSDVKHFEFEPGASSSNINAFEQLGAASLAPSHPHEALLEPGDILFLPPLWLHTASPTSGMSIAVNVFFRNLQAGYAAGKDVYGNRDLQAYEKGRQDIARILKTFEGLPVDVRGFYLQRLVDELEQKSH